MKRFVLPIVLMTLVALVLAACGQQQTTTPPAAPTTAPAAAKPTDAPSAAKPAATTAQQSAAPTAAPATQATQAPAAAKTQRGGQFINASFADAATMQPLLSQDTASNAYINLVYAGLTRVDPDTLDVLGNLYEGKGQLSSDGKTLTWKLRPGLKWSDGQPITAKDVEFTWNKMMDEKVKFPYRKLYQDSFTSVKAKDDLTVEYTLTTAGFCPALINSGLAGPIPEHVFKDLDVNQNDANNKPSVVSGLFKLKEWNKDANALFSPPFEGFVRGQPNLDQYVYRIVKDNTVATQLFKTQEIDYLAPNAIDFDEISKLPHSQVFRYYSPNASWVYIGFNLRNDLLKDKALRQAISTAIPKEDIIKTVRRGLAKPQNSIYAPASWAYTDDVPKFEFNTDKAKQMLDAAGYKVGAGGVREKDGKPLKFRIHYNAGNNERQQIAEISQQYLKDIGIEAEVLAEEWNAYLNRINQTRDFDMFVLGWSSSIEPNGFGNIFGSKGTQNSTGYANEQVDKLFDQAANVPGCSQADRQKVYAQIQKIVAEDAPYVFMYVNENIDVYNKRIQVNPLKKLGAGYEVEKWSVVQATK